MTDKPRAEPTRRAVAGPLVKQSDPTKVVAWFCVNCGTVHKTKDDAERCTTVYNHNDPSKNCTEWSCETCGKPAFSTYQWYCRDCLTKRREVREDEKLAAAEKVISAKDYPDDQGVTYHNDYYYSLDMLLESFAEEGLDPPKRVWATKPVKFSLYADEILANEWENWSEGCEEIDIGEMCGVDEFEEAVEAFNRKQSACIYYQTSTVVDLTEGE